MTTLAGGTVVLVTGASSGIGRAAAHVFSREGARLVLTARNKDALNLVAEECGAIGGEALPLPADMTEEAAVELLRALAVREYGEAPSPGGPSAVSRSCWNSGRGLRPERSSGSSRASGRRCNSALRLNRIRMATCSAACRYSQRP